MVKPPDPKTLEIFQRKNILPNAGPKNGDESHGTTILFWTMLYKSAKKMYLKKKKKHIQTKSKTLRLCDRLKVKNKAWLSLQSFRAPQWTARSNRTRSQCPLVHLKHTETMEKCNLLKGQIWFKKTWHRMEEHLVKVFIGMYVLYICAMVKSRYIGDGHPTFNDGILIIGI